MPGTDDIHVEGSLLCVREHTVLNFVYEEPYYVWMCATGRIVLWATNRQLFLSMT